MITSAGVYRDNLKLQGGTQDIVAVVADRCHQIVETLTIMSEALMATRHLNSRLHLRYFDI